MNEKIESEEDEDILSSGYVDYSQMTVVFFFVLLPLMSELIVMSTFCI